jgi:uncharacterized sulfatase
MNHHRPEPAEENSMIDRGLIATVKTRRPTRTWTPLALGLVVALAAAARSDEKLGDERPDILFILSDDHHWADYGFMGHPTLRTPALDRLAREGTLFRRGYVPTSLCRPSLATMLTGRFPHEHGITGNDPGWPFARAAAAKAAPRATPSRQARDEVARRFAENPRLPEILARHGYATFQTGKWWEGAPSLGGFTGGMSHGDPARGGRHGDDGLAIGRTTMAPALDFIDRSVKAGQPWFLWYAPMLPHTPHDPPADLLARHLMSAPNPREARYRAMVERFDRSIGELLDHLDRRGRTAKTLVVYVTDNGWIQSADRDLYAPRSKRSPNEGGLRTPIILRQPGRVPVQDRTEPAGSIDLMPTLLAAAKAPVEQAEGTLGRLPGINLLDPAAVARPRALFGATFEHDIPDLARPVAGLLHRWVLDGDLKLIIPSARAGGAPELYDLRADPDESTDLAPFRPNDVARLRIRLDGWWKP